MPICNGSYNCDTSSIIEDDVYYWGISAVIRVSFDAVNLTFWPLLINVMPHCYTNRSWTYDKMNVWPWTCFICDEMLYWVFSTIYFETFFDNLSRIFNPPWQNYSFSYRDLTFTFNYIAWFNIEYIFPISYNKIMTNNSVL